jgi:hypothetical protein
VERCPDDAEALLSLSAALAKVAKFEDSRAAVMAAAEQDPMVGPLPPAVPSGMPSLWFAVRAGSVLGLSAPVGVLVAVWQVKEHLMDGLLADLDKAERAAVVLESSSGKSTAEEDLTHLSGDEPQAGRKGR